MRVIATKMGFYGGSRVRVGQVFSVPEGTTGKWFKAAEDQTAEPVEQAKATKAKATKAKLGNDPQTFSEIAKRDEDTQTGAA